MELARRMLVEADREMRLTSMESWLLLGQLQVEKVISSQPSQFKATEMKGENRLMQRRLAKERIVAALDDENKCWKTTAPPPS